MDNSLKLEQFPVPSGPRLGARPDIISSRLGGGTAAGNCAPRYIGKGCCFSARFTVEQGDLFKFYEAQRSSFKFL